MSSLNTLLQQVLQHPWWVISGGLIPIVVFLFAFGHATLGPSHPGDGDSGCVDDRVNTDIEILGGAAGFTFGLHYFTLAFIAGHFGYNQLSEFFEAYARLHLVVSAAQVPLYLVQVRSSNNFNGLLKAHLDGCGWTTGVSIFWLLFWLPMLPIIGPYLKWTIFFRDLITRVDYVTSKLAVWLVLSPLTKWFFGKPTETAILHVERPRL